MYHAIVKRVAAKNFLRVNQKNYAAVLKGCSTHVHHRFGGITPWVASGMIAKHCVNGLCV